MKVKDKKYSIKLTESQVLNMVDLIDEWTELHGGKGGAVWYLDELRSSLSSQLFHHKNKLA